MAMAKFKTVDAYLKAVPEPARAALQKLRAAIAAAAPGATEAISYGMPAFRLNGGLVAYAAFKNHCSFFPMSSTLVAEYAEELESFATATGTIRFTVEKPLPVALMKKLVKERVAQNARKAAAKAAKRKKS